MNEIIKKLSVIIFPLFMLSGFYLAVSLDEENFENCKDQYVIKPSLDNLEIINSKYLDLYNRNNDFIGWIRVPNTSIDYPVMKSLEDEYKYLRRDFNGNYSQRGAIFLDPRSSISSNSLNMLIYGHNMKDGSMFHDLLKFRNMKFALNNKIYFDTLYGSRCYEVISVFNAEIGKTFPYYRYSYIDNNEKFKEYISYLRENGDFFIDLDNFDAELISLSTCSYHVRGRNGRFVVVARRINDI